MATHKASKFFGKIGLGRKSKALTHQPKDYNAQKSSSVQELLPKSPTSERARVGVSLSATSSGISDFDNTVTVSPGHKTEKGGHGGARPKEPAGGGLSPKQSTSERHSMISCTDEAGIVGPAASDPVRNADYGPVTCIIVMIVCLSIKYVDTAVLHVQSIGYSVISVCLASVTTWMHYSISLALGLSLCVLAIAYTVIIDLLLVTKC